MVYHHKITEFLKLGKPVNEIIDVPPTRIDALIYQIRDITKNEAMRYKAKEADLKKSIAWYRTRTSLWREGEYAQFLYAYVYMFFEPTRPLKIVGRDDKIVSRTADSETHDGVIKEAAMLFKFLHETDANLAKFFNSMWADCKKRKLTNEKVTKGVAWRDLDDISLYNEIRNVWIYTTQKAEEAGNNPDNREALPKAFLTKNIPLICKKLDLPYIVGIMLYHHYMAEYMMALQRQNVKK